MSFKLGTMSGGGKSVSKGRMGGKIVQDVGAKDVDEMEKDVDAVVSKLEVGFYSKIARPNAEFGLIL